MTIELAASIAFLTDAIKNIIKLGEEQRYAEVMKGISEMSIKLSEMGVSASILQNENTALKEEIKKLRDFESRGLHLKDGAMYDKNNNGPYCPNCYENHKLLNLMSPPLSGDNPKCTQCRYIMP